ncbi:hypothetical protein IGI04_035975 [Brassica rapa subsp. trilocularis]|uniref:RNA helicase n=1 Tax=Brassica rapa subsp. trilocularis TaxID=1813537 RepID=A0ABQ7LFW2_BRACM|nr:hypothetical protein IGI04_035975 [Brassica rapa subsp. trilocularis]
MAPKKKPQKNQTNSKAYTSSIPNSSHKKPSKVPKLLISPEDEDRLRRLLLSFRRTASPVRAPVRNSLISTGNSLAKSFQMIRLNSTLSSLRDGATFESALDWLCLNFPSHELPLWFSCGASRGSVSVISTKRKDWNQPAESSHKVQEKREESEVLVQVKGRRDEEDTLSSCHSSQADWIRQYRTRLEEEEMESSDVEERTKEYLKAFGFGSWIVVVLKKAITWVKFIELNPLETLLKVSGPRPFDVIAEEYCLERSDAVKAKQKGDTSRQKQAGLAICKLKQELSGISEAMLESEFLREQAFEDATEKEVKPPKRDDVHESVNADALSIQLLDDMNLDANPVGSRSSEKIQPKALPLSSPGQELAISHDIFDDMELGDLFSEDVPPYEPSPHELLGRQKKEIMRELRDEKNLGKLEGIWKKGEAQKIPKALLHRLCQKSGWEAPKFNKATWEGSKFSYTISVMCKSSGCGKSRQAGGLVTIKRSHQVEDFASIEDAQNRVASFALHKLFSDLPVHSAITEPYASLVLVWKQEESLGIQSREEERREKFVDSLLEAHNFTLTALPNGMHGVIPLVDSCVKESDDLNVVKSNHRAKRNISMEAVCSSLKRRQENNKKTQKYKRCSSYIRNKKNDILHHLKEKDVLVVCGETGSGKTTQVPQYILDDMIDSGHGGYCNIICTQPWVMAAISVAQKVADERCESPPGLGDSLDGYQGDKTLKDVTHIIVDEVHERALKSDFLLIILKRLIEKQSCDKSSHKLKVILMSATVHASQFSRYFGQCPVLTAQGRMHPLGSVKVRGRKKNPMLAGWGDNYLVTEDCLNSTYVSSNYESYSDRTKENLKRLNDDIIDYKLLEEFICHIDTSYEEGAILVFLPFSWTYYRLASASAFSVAHTEQKKVIVATNIAETSITMDDVVYVIDSGKHKENRYNPQMKLSSMVEDWISKANARQRAGRAGRVKPGLWFSLYTRHRFEKLMRPYQALEPPSEGAINSAVSLFHKVGAIEGDKALTPLGHHLAKLPVDVLIGKKQNVDRVKVPLLSDNRRVREGIHAAERFCDSKFMSSSVMRTISDLRIEFGTLLADIGLINLRKSKTEEKPFNMYSQEPEVVKAVLCVGLCPNIAEGLVNRLAKPEKQTQRYAVWHDGRREVHIHPTSINKTCKAFQYPFLVFLEKVESKKIVNLRDTTIVSPFSILLFGGSVDVQHHSGSVTIDGWLKLAAPAQTAVLFKELQLTLHSILKDLIRNPEKSGIVHIEVVKSMVHLLIQEGKTATRMN